ncbi:hypothetical protein AB2S62_20115 [Vibrio sp. NTOU-M3]|uniref:hypothetical protein n=1 Tax=Vibrio sp. NTOU-M3 TaxID=3234954 RepID=UPI00349F9350
MKCLSLLFLALSLILSASTFAKQLEGSYVYDGSSERIFITFPRPGVANFVRYPGSYTNDGVVYKDKPSESGFVPYVMKGNNSAQALICSYYSPKNECWVTNISINGNTLKWDRIPLKRTDKTFRNDKDSKFKNMSFEQLAEHYGSKMALIK